MEKSITKTEGGKNMSPLMILGIAGVVGFGLYKSVKPIDDFVNNFRFYIESFDVDFLKVKNYTVPAMVKIVLVNNEDYEPLVESLVVTVYKLDDEKNKWAMLMTSKPQLPFKIPKRTQYKKTINFVIPIQGAGSELLDIVSNVFNKKKSKFKIEVSTKVKGQIFTEQEIKEF